MTMMSLTFMIKISFILLTCFPLLVTSATNSNNKAQLHSPIQQLEGSLAASAAYGTVVAVQSFRDNKNEGENSVVLLSRTPTSPNRLASNLTRIAVVNQLWKNPIGSEENKRNSTSHNNTAADERGEVLLSSQDKYLIPVMSRGSVKINANSLPEHFPRNLRGSYWQDEKESHTLHVLQESSGLCVAMTGFASDVNHLVRYGAKQVLEHEKLYLDANQDVHKFVRQKLAPKMRKAAFVGNGRPFGVEALVIGSNRAEKTKPCFNNLFNSIMLYTIDPSGNWKHWGGGGTCIGKSAVIVRKHLHQILYPMSEGIVSNEKQNCYPKNWTQALDIAMQACYDGIEKSENEDDMNQHIIEEERAASQYDAIVLFGSETNSDKCRCSKIDQEAILASYRKCVSG